VLRTKVCPRCGNENPSEAGFCNRCRLFLDEKIALEVKKKEEEFLSRLIDEEILEK